MKPSFLLLLLLPLSSLAQSGPRNYIQQNQQARQDFNRMNTQRFQDQQMRQLNRDRPMQSGTRRLAPELLTPGQQLKAEQEATEKLTRLAQEQQRKRQEHPAPNPQQAAAQQKEDDKQLALLAATYYRDVFLAGQLAKALQARSLSAPAQRDLQKLNDKLLKDEWWSKQEAAQLPANIKAYGDTLTTLVAGLLGFDLASPPPTPEQLAASRFEALRTNGKFDQAAAGQLVEEAALAEKILAGRGLAEAVVDFQKLSTPARPELQNDPQKLRKETITSLRQV